MTLHNWPTWLYTCRLTIAANQIESRMVKGLKVSVDLNLDAVSSPGTVLGTRGPLYIEMQIFRHVLRSEASPSIFPVLLHKRLNITHIFPYLTDPGQLASELAKQMISIKLIQEGALGDQILAQYAASARDFLFPTPSLSDTYPGVHREILMNRTQFYTGLLEPKLEFRWRFQTKDWYLKIHYSVQKPSSKRWQRVENLEGRRLQTVFEVHPLFEAVVLLKCRKVTTVLPELPQRTFSRRSRFFWSRINVLTSFTDTTKQKKSVKKRIASGWRSSFHEHYDLLPCQIPWSKERV